MKRRAGRDKRSARFFCVRPTAFDSIFPLFRPCNMGHLSPKVRLDAHQTFDEKNEAITTDATSSSRTRRHTEPSFAFGSSGDWWALTFALN